MVIEIIIFAVLFFFGILFWIVYTGDSIFGGEDFTTSRAAAKQIAAIIKAKHLEAGYLYDLGSCRGRFAVQLAKELPGLKIRGVDNNWFRIIFSKARAVFLKNLTFKRGNIFNEDISSADVVYLYLPKELMPALQTKLQKELKTGSLVITNRVSFSSWQPIQSYDVQNPSQVFEKLFVYQK